MKIKSPRNFPNLALIEPAGTKWTVRSEESGKKILLGQSDSKLNLDILFPFKKNFRC